MWKIVIGGATCSLLCLSLMVRSSDHVPSAPRQPSPRTVFVHLFEWTWEDVAQECEMVLGPGGVAAVQVSPANEHVVLPDAGFPWWQRYQPVSYQIQSRSGDRQQFADMVARCHRAGVEVYADAVINHMAAIAATGSAGTAFTPYHYPNLYGPDDFHPCQTDIKDYTNRAEVTTCPLVGLPDLATGSERVRDRLAAYLTDLASLGVDGFRIDAAKHISSTDLTAILDRFRHTSPTDAYIYQEVIDPGHEAINKQEYYGNGDVTEFEYGRRVGEVFLGLQGQTLTQLQTLGESWGLMPSDKAIVFIDNHDKQRGHGGGGTYLTYKSGDLYDLANIFMLAFPYGYPQVMSSYAFDHPDQGPPADAQGHTRPVYTNGGTRCFQEWVCEHRRPAIAAMIRFRNATADRFEVTDWWSNGRNQIAFGRGDRGFVVINRESEVLTHTFQTQLPPGDYCNVITSQPGTAAPCTATSQVTVNAQGQFTAAIAPLSALAIHQDAAQPTPLAQPTYSAR